MSPQKGATGAGAGGFRLNISVGAKNAEKAEKFKILD